MNGRLTIPIALVCMAMALAIGGCGGGDDSSSSPSSETSSPASSEAASEPQAAGEVGKKKPKITVPSGPEPKALEKKELVEGTGTEAKGGDEVTVQYVGIGYKTKKQFDASWDRGEPFTFTLGTGGVIPGWEYGIVGMKEGGRRELIIPGPLAYGAEGSPPSIGPNETLIFVIDLLAVK